MDSWNCLVFKRPGVARALLQTELLFIHLFACLSQLSREAKNFKAYSPNFSFVCVFNSLNICFTDLSSGFYACFSSFKVVFSEDIDKAVNILFCSTVRSTGTIGGVMLVFSRHCSIIVIHISWGEGRGDHMLSTKV